MKEHKLEMRSLQLRVACENVEWTKVAGNGKCVEESKLKINA
jgi:hypothetical protein